MIGDGQNFPQITAPITDPKTGIATSVFYYLMNAVWSRTGGSDNIVGQGIFSGDVRSFAGPAENIPGGWLPCDGSAVSRTTFLALFRAIGTTWGTGDGSTTFNIPDMRDRVVIGSGNLYPLGSTGGAANETLTIDNLPAHNHVVDDPEHTHAFTGVAHAHGVTDAGHTHTDGAPNPTADVAAGAAKTSAIAGMTGSSTTGIVIQSTTAGGTNAASATGVTTENTGSSDPFSLLPPYAALLYIIKT